MRTDAQAGRAGRSGSQAPWIAVLVSAFAMLLVPPAFAQEAQDVPSPLQSAQLLVDASPWGQWLLVLTAIIAVIIVFCTLNAGRAFRSGSAEALKRLPTQLDADGLMQILNLENISRHPASSLMRALRVGLVAGRGGLLLSKSAVLAAWESEKTAYRFWPRVLLALGLVSLAFGVLASISRLPDGIAIWRMAALEGGGMPDPFEMIRYLDILRQAHFLFFWGVANFFVALLLYFAFDRMIQVFLNRTTLLLIQYLGNSVYREVATFSKASDSSGRISKGNTDPNG